MAQDALSSLESKLYEAADQLAGQGAVQGLRVADAESAVSADLESGVATAFRRQDAAPATSADSGLTLSGTADLSLTAAPSGPPPASATEGTQTQGAPAPAPIPLSRPIDLEGGGARPALLDAATLASDGEVALPGQAVIPGVPGAPVVALPVSPDPAPDETPGPVPPGPPAPPVVTGPVPPGPGTDPDVGADPVIAPPGPLAPPVVTGPGTDPDVGTDPGVAPLDPAAPPVVTGPVPPGPGADPGVVTDPGIAPLDPVTPPVVAGPVPPGPGADPGVVTDPGVAPLDPVTPPVVTGPVPPGPGADPGVVTDPGVAPLDPAAPPVVAGPVPPGPGADPEFGAEPADAPPGSSPSSPAATPSPGTGTPASSEGGSSSAGPDTDLTVDAGLGLVETGLDVTLDPVEAVLGTDIDLGVAVDLAPVVDTATGLLGDVVAGVTPSPAPATGPDTDLTVDAGLGLVETGLDVTLDPVEAVLGTDIDLGVAVDLAPVVDTATGLLADVVAGVTTAPAAGSDTDLTVDAGLGLVDTGLDVTLDPVEAVLGTDVDLGVAVDLAPVLDTATGLLGDVVAGVTPSPAPATGPDTDLTVDAGLGLVETGLDVTLDPVEAVLGTDIDLGVAVDLAPVVDTATGLLGDVVTGVTPSPAPGEDTDLTVDAGLGMVDTGLEVTLDPVETVLGTDVDLGVVLDLAPVVDTATGLLGDVVAGGTPSPAPGPDTDLTVDAGLGLIDTGLEVILDPVEAVLGTDVDLGVAIDLAPVGDTATGLLGDVVTGVTPSPAPGEDTDLTVDAGLGLVDTGLEVTLDPVEAILGTDVDLGVAVDLAPVVDTAVGLLGDVAGVAPSPAPGPDTDLSVDAGLGLVDTGLDVTLDPVETVLGTDIDLGVALDLAPVVDTATGLLGDVVAGVTTAPAAGSDTDLTVDAGLGLVETGLDVTLDPVETVLGTDIDLGVDLDLAPVVDFGTDLLDDVVAGGSTAPAPGPDTDLTLDAGLGLVDTGLDVTLDPVEALLGTDVDLDLALDADILGLDAAVQPGASLLSESPVVDLFELAGGPDSSSDLAAEPDLFATLGDLPTSDLSLSQLLDGASLLGEPTLSQDYFDAAPTTELASVPVLSSPANLITLSTGTEPPAALVGTALVETVTAPVTATLTSATSALRSFGSRLF